MRRLDHVLSRVAERGDPLGADLLIDHLERKLAGEPDPIVVARQRSGTMQTVKERTIHEPGPPTRRKGLAVALATFVVVLIAGGGIILWAAVDDDGDAAAPATTQATTTQATTQAPTTTQVPATTQAPPVDAAATFTFDGTTWSYAGPNTLEAGKVTFELVNTSSAEVAVFSWFGLEGEELEAQLNIAPVGTDVGPSSDAPSPPPSDFLWLVEAGPGETVATAQVLGMGSHLIHAATMADGGVDHLWSIAFIEVIEPENLTTGDAMGTFTFDGTAWSYDGPTTLEAGTITFALVNTGSEPIAVFSWFGLSGNELEAELATTPLGTDIGPFSEAPPAPPSDFLWLVEAEPGESALGVAIMGAGEHLIDAATLTVGGGTDHLWRVTVIEVIAP